MGSQTLLHVAPPYANEAVRFTNISFGWAMYPIWSASNLFCWCRAAFLEILQAEVVSYLHMCDVEQAAKSKQIADETMILRRRAWSERNPCSVDT